MCPCCGEDTLRQNGGFWLCTTCGLAITEQALAYERLQATREKEGTRDLPASPRR